MDHRPTAQTKTIKLKMGVEFCDLESVKGLEAQKHQGREK